LIDWLNQLTGRLVAARQLVVLNRLTDWLITTGLLVVLNWLTGYY